MTKDLNNLLEVAREAAKQAYAPYSGYHVGSAVKCTDGSVYSACNVENASYSLSICAERAAIFKALSEGKRDFTAIAIYVDSDKIFPPCGACRQVIYEFSPKITVVYANHDETIETTIAELLPGAFGL
ncbi:MAG: cytidine deaminase [Candidatus Cloacimonetes bacterium]|jgi:cytidine deaminase|nr:cytidine deaminase [Candidatus Cloacimonadota bacterium]MCB5287142.1 cytidine deaminase [Candidatus Cloacimonadota bacterium]MCK9185412.1 cytidine deaminase [Candidatus Cloacimonadota bacterium]MCK9584650.1 cytidine deaminase [Candidatus Cloacimonadota bacterium]MDY0229463.1 cytidine deaminase [Candidatus Cloacimonadaceae bacterium]